MRRRLIVVSAVLVLAIAAWIGCVEWTYQPPTATGKETGLSKHVIRLDDGREVRVEFSSAGLVVQHRRTQNHPWSEQKVLYPKEGDFECTVSLSTYRETVTVVARYYPGCYADSEPHAMIVAVSDGDLDEWDTQVTTGALSWDDAPPQYSMLGQRVVFRTSRRAGAEELSWRNTIGFTGETSPLSEDY